jgi:hypothetical protein
MDRSLSTEIVVGHVDPQLPQTVDHRGVHVERGDQLSSVVDRLVFNVDPLYRLDIFTMRKVEVGAYTDTGERELVRKMRPSTRSPGQLALSYLGSSWCRGPKHGRGMGLEPVVACLYTNP